jgi:AhpD family alkylhydroperoxidase
MNPDEKSQELLSGVKKMLGSTPNLFTTLAHSSAALGYYVNGVVALSATKIPGSLREQLALTVAGENSCDYCASAHTTLGKMQKIAEGELTNNLHGKSEDVRIQAALSFAKKIVELRGHVSDSDVKAVRDAGYSDVEIVEIVAVVTQNIFTNYFNHIAGTEIDFPMVSTSCVKKAA